MATVGNYKIQRVIRWFDNVTEEQIGEHIIKNANLKQLQKIFNGTGPMVEPYPVESFRERMFVENAYGIQLDPRYCYFLECDAI